jgi:hypothetical protein
MFEVSCFMEKDKKMVNKLERTFQILDEKQLHHKKIEQMLLQDKWKLHREKISFYTCIIGLVALIGTSIYIVCNAESFPFEVVFGIMGMFYLLPFVFVGYITNTPSLLRAVASAIITFSTKQTNKNKED